jgi:hypothetical protein
MDSSVLLISEFSQLVWAALALAAALIGFGVYRRSQTSVEPQPTPAPIVRAVYSDAPTVRVLDSQHFDRLHKTLRLTPGEHADILPAHPVIGARFRITLNAIALHDATDAAHIAVVYAGAQVSCGPLAREVGYNEFLVPRAARDESRSAVFHYQESSHALEFMRIKITAIDRSTNQVELEVTQMRGRWPTGQG